LPARGRLKNERACRVAENGATGSLDVQGFGSGTFGRAARGLSLGHPLSVMTAVVVVMTPVAMMPVATLTEGAAAAGHENDESEKGTDLLHS